MLAVLKFDSQQFDWAANRMAGELYDAPVEGYTTVHSGEQTKCSFPPYVGGLERGAILQNRQQRENRTLRKIGVFEKATRIADYVAKLELDRLKMWIYPLAAG